MKKFLTKKSRKLILLLLLGFRYYIIMKVSFVSMLNINNSSINNNSNIDNNIDTNDISISINNISSSSSSSNSNGNNISGSSNNVSSISISSRSSINKNFAIVKSTTTSAAAAAAAASVPVPVTLESATLAESIMSLSSSSSSNMMTTMKSNSKESSDTIIIRNFNRILNETRTSSDNYLKVKLKNLTNMKLFKKFPSKSNKKLEQKYQIQNENHDNRKIHNKIIILNRQKNHNKDINENKKFHMMTIQRNYSKYNKCKNNIVNCFKNKLKRKIRSKDNDDDGSNLENIKNSEYEEQNAIVIAMKHENYDDDNDDRNRNRNRMNKNNKIYSIQSEAGPILIDDSFKNEDTDYDMESENLYSDTLTTPTSIDESDSNFNDNESYDTNDDGETSYDNRPQYDYNDESETSDRQMKSSNSYFVTAKNLWDIFMTINSAWNSLAKQQEKQQEQQEQQQEKQQNNENFSSKFIINENQTNRNDNDKINDEERLRRDSFYSEIGKYPKYINRRNSSDWTYYEHNPRPLSSSAPTTILDTTTKKTSIVEGRYIKGDPLKGYYDFVITEGSYKFWACFQLATAILIIYSTFAAIYYSKVNPLVGDYDYVDYLGGARSLSESSNENSYDDTDEDFIDDETSASSYHASRSRSSNSGRSYNNGSSSSDNSKTSTLTSNTRINKTTLWSSIMNGDWVPRTEYTIKFILDAIDKIPSSS